jgi:hypothetical protein
MIRKDMVARHSAPPGTADELASAFAQDMMPCSTDHEDDLLDVAAEPVGGRTNHDLEARRGLNPGNGRRDDVPTQVPPGALRSGAEKGS